MLVSGGAGAVAVPVGLGGEWECEGFLPKVTVTAMGAAAKLLSHGHVLELQVQFSSSRVTSVNIDPATSSLSQERIPESATGINPFPASPATELSKGHLSAYGWKSFVPKKIFQRQSQVTQLF